MCTLPEDDAGEGTPVPKEDAEAHSAESYFEKRARELYGPPEVRARKRQRYVERLVRRYSEPVIRGIILALGRLEDPLCARFLGERLDEGAPLTDVIQNFELGGPKFRVVSVTGDDYTVEVSGGFGTAGDGGKFVVGRDGADWVVKEFLEAWIS